MRALRGSDAELAGLIVLGLVCYVLLVPVRVARWAKELRK